MGGHSSTPKRLQEVQEVATRALGKAAVSGRYHHHPRTLEADYTPEKRVLGTGYSGAVKSAVSKTTGETFAVKTFKLHGVGKEKKDELQAESEIFLSMDHPNVARLVDVYEGQDTLDLVMEFMAGGELFQRICSQKVFSERAAAEAAWQMLLAINYIHSHSIVHRDIKLENFMYDTKEYKCLKLIDFGFSEIWHKDHKMMLSCGTLSYAAPELLSGQGYGSEVDMWSFGIIVYILLMGRMPFPVQNKSQNEAIRTICRGDFRAHAKGKFERLSPLSQDFLGRLLVVNPKDRMESDEALKHEWIAKCTSHPDVMDSSLAESLVAYSHASTFRRACMSVMAWSLTNEERAECRDIFLEMDENRSGTVSAREFKKVLEERFNVADSDAMAAFASLHTSPDEEIHYTEFLAAMVSQRLKMSDELLLSTFNRFDREEKGAITAEDFRSILGDKFQGVDVAALLKEAGVDGPVTKEQFFHYMKNASHHDDHREKIFDLVHASA